MIHPRRSDGTAVTGGYEGEHSHNAQVAGPFRLWTSEQPQDDVRARWPRELCLLKNGPRIASHHGATCPG